MTSAVVSWFSAGVFDASSRKHLVGNSQSCPSGARRALAPGVGLAARQRGPLPVSNLPGVEVP